MRDTRANRYWEANLKLVLKLLCIWFLVPFAGGIVFVDFLDNYRFAGFKLGFWISQQGAILAFVGIILLYIRGMDQLDKKFSGHSDSSEPSNLEGVIE